MSALTVLRQFETAAYDAQKAHLKSPLVYRLDGQVVCDSSASAKDKKLHQDTWRVFIDRVKNVLGEPKYQWICRRYKINPERMQALGKPLLSAYVELFSIGASQIFTRDIKRMLPEGSKIKQITRKTLCEKFYQAQPFCNILGPYLNPTDISGPPTVFKAWFMHDLILMDREKQILFSDIQNLSFSAFLERFCKVIVNRELVEKQIIPVPGVNGQLDFYRVYKKICTGSGLVAYALKPAAADSALNPLLIFRPTQMAPSQEDAFPSYLNDLEPTIGLSGYLGAKASLEQLINDSSFVKPGEMIHIAGYSLGGAHAQLFLADYFPKVSSAYFFSNPSVDRQTAERFAAGIQASNRQEPLNLYIFRTYKDFVHCAGEMHVGCNVTHPSVNIIVYNVNHEDHTIDALSQHSFKIFDNSNMNYRMQCVKNPQELFKQLDNSKRGAEVLWYERMRQIWGRVAHFLLSILHTLLTAIKKLLAIKILRSSQD
ncbi:MAG TPA: hypothetical protein VGJ00_09565 [Rhabdochlamydiaceae bacterium]|jgi:hypothetical protein